MLLVDHNRGFIMSHFLVWRTKRFKVLFPKWIFLTSSVFGDFRIICSLSAIVVVFVFVLLFSTIILDEQQERSLIFNSTTNDTTWENILSLYGVLSFQFDIHPSILIIYNDMKQKSEMHQALIGGFLGK